VELGEWLRVDGRAGRPLFDQLRNQVIDAIRDGTLPPGARLPTVRELAGQLGLAVNTVARSYLDVARGLGLGKADALRYLEAAPDD
jgi:DNA-binding transcriptional regulator YhcF (GntR family)